MNCFWEPKSHFPKSSTDNAMLRRMMPEACIRFCSFAKHRHAGPFYPCEKGDATSGLHVPAALSCSTSTAPGSSPTVSSNMSRPSADFAFCAEPKAKTRKTSTKCGAETKQLFRSAAQSSGFTRTGHTYKGAIFLQREPGQAFMLDRRFNHGLTPLGKP